MKFPPTKRQLKEFSNKLEMFFKTNVERLSVTFTNNWFDRTDCRKCSATFALFYFYQVVWRHR